MVNGDLKLEKIIIGCIKPLVVFYNLRQFSNSFFGKNIFSIYLISNVPLNISYMYTGRDLRLLRLIKGIPQKTIANKLSTSQQAVSKKEYSEKVSDENFEEYLNAANSSKEEFEKKVLPPPPINKITTLKRMLY
jgi:hypothetical protein